MTPTIVTKNFAVAPQIHPEDLKDVADAGYGTVICNRPDGEEPDQPTAEAMREAADALGLSFHYIPVSGGAFPAAAIAAFGKVREKSDGKVLAYCRTATRSITLDALANIENSSAEERIERGRRAGYDLSGIRTQIGE